MDWIKNLLNTAGRNLIVKYLTRFILWGGAAISAKYGVDGPKDNVAAEAAAWIAAVVCAALAAYIDLKHQKADKAEIPAEISPTEMVAPRVTPPAPGT